MPKMEKDSTLDSNESIPVVTDQNTGEPARNKGGRPKGSK